MTFIRQIFSERAVQEVHDNYNSKLGRVQLLNVLFSKYTEVQLLLFVHNSN